MRLSVIVAVTAVLSGMSGCAFEEKSRADFERHNNSVLRTSYQDSSMLVFEARAGATFPEDSPSAEDLRLGWLHDWLDRQGLCPDGYEIVSRERIPPGQPNFYDMDLRYLVRCSSTPPPEETPGK